MTARYAHKVTDAALIRPLLERDRVTNAYLLGDLDPLYFGFTTWYISGTEAGDDTVILIYDALSVPVVLSSGHADGVASILGCFIDQLPERAHVHMATDHLAAFDHCFAIDNLRPMVRMGLAVEDIDREARWDVPGAEVVPLGHRDTGDIMSLSHHYPDSFFEPSQLSTGYYVGVRLEGELVAMAGVHLVSRADRLAVLGNIVTHPEHRARGLSTACTAYLCQRLADDGIAALALNVERRNRWAVRVYEKLGFREHTTYVEGVLARTLDYKISQAR